MIQLGTKKSVNKKQSVADIANVNVTFKVITLFFLLKKKTNEKDTLWLYKKESNPTGF